MIHDCKICTRFWTFIRLIIAYKYFGLTQSSKYFVSPTWDIEILKILHESQLGLMQYSNMLRKSHLGLIKSVDIFISHLQPLGIDRSVYQQQQPQQLGHMGYSKILPKSQLGLMQYSHILRKSHLGLMEYTIILHKTQLGLMQYIVSIA